MPRFLASLLAVCLGSAVSSLASADQLTVKQISPLDALLTWQASPGSPGGYIVEYINHPTDEWVILSFVSPGRNTFTHPRLAPHTPYRYRVRPFFGPTSKPVEVTIAAGLSDQAYAEAYAQPEDYSWAPPRTRSAPNESVLARNPIKPPATAARAAPVDLRAEIVKTTVSGFQLTWNDRSTDEEGFLLEQLGPGSDFTVVAVVEPNINTFGWALEPPVRKASFRVRAYYYGSPSNVVSIVTGTNPAEEAGQPSAPRTSTSPKSSDKT